MIAPLKNRGWGSHGYLAGDPPPRSKKGLSVFRGAGAAEKAGDLVREGKKKGGG